MLTESVFVYTEYRHAMLHGRFFILCLVFNQISTCILSQTCELLTTIREFCDDAVLNILFVTVFGIQWKQQELLTY